MMTGTDLSGVLELVVQKFKVDEKQSRGSLE
jgi:hypothetical protein